MLYVNDVEESSAFWRSIGFVETQRQEIDGSLIVEIAVTKESPIKFTLYDLAFVQQNSPEVNTVPPSILFEADNIEKLHTKMRELKIKTGELVLMGNQMIFNFADNNEYYFAVTSN